MPEMGGIRIDITQLGGYRWISLASSKMGNEGDMSVSVGMVVEPTHWEKFNRGRFCCGGWSAGSRCFGTDAHYLDFLFLARDIRALIYISWKVEDWLATGHTGS